MPASSAADLPLSLLQRLCTSAEMRRWEANAIEQLGIPGRELMENAARTVARHVLALLRDNSAAGPVAVCCGSGNNGGDGYAVARLLKNDGVDAAVIRAGIPTGADALGNMEDWNGLGVTVDYGAQRDEASTLLGRAGVIVDALFGTGLNRPVEGEAADLIADINAAPAPLKIAVDVPSGINSDTGAVMGHGARCTHTVTFQVGKVGCRQYPGAAHAGTVWVEDISVPVSWTAEDPAIYLLNLPFARALLPHRPPDGHKGSFGHLLAVCGSAGMGGAALLAGLAGLKAGTGLVTLGVPRCLRDAFLGPAPELMTLSPDDGDALAFADEHAALYLEAARTRSAVVLGCGLGQAPQTQAFVGRLVEGVQAPLLIDADGLNALRPSDIAQRKFPTVLTPHPGELARLAGLDSEGLAADRVGIARRLAGEWGVILLLKGAGTVVAAPTGEVFINTSGDEAMATAGAGDVLSGIIGGLLAQRMAPLAATLLGVFLHGLARDCQREEVAGAYFSAGDLIRGLNRAFLELAG